MCYCCCLCCSFSCVSMDELLKIVLSSGCVSFCASYISCVGVFGFQYWFLK